MDLTSYSFLCKNRENRREEFTIEVILTLENRNGMLFNHRILSRDKNMNYMDTTSRAIRGLVKLKAEPPE